MLFNKPFLGLSQSIFFFIIIIKKSTLGTSDLFFAVKNYLHIL